MGRHSLHPRLTFSLLRYLVQELALSGAAKGNRDVFVLAAKVADVQAPTSPKDVWLIVDIIDCISSLARLVIGSNRPKFGLAPRT